MEIENKDRTLFENSFSNTEADKRKAQLVSNIIKKAEKGDEEEEKGRS